MKRLICFILVLALMPVFSLMSNAETYDGFEYEEDEGEIYITGYTGSDAEVVIPSEIDGKPVVAIEKEAFVDNNDITKVVIPDSVKGIGDCAFARCSNLEDIQFGESVVYLYYSSFEDTAYFDDEDNWVDGLLYLNGCLIYADFDLSGDVTIKTGTRLVAESALEYCEDITSITIPASMRYICDRAFTDCTSLATVTFYTGVEYIGSEAFSNTALTSFTLPSTVKFFGLGVFSGCDRLETLKVNMNNKVFDSRKGCNAIIYTEENVLVQGCWTTTIPEGITAIAMKAFESTPITKMVIPSSVEVIGSQAFGLCSALTEFEFSSNTTLILEEAFYGCEALSTVTYNGTEKSIDDLTIEKGNETLTAVEWNIVAPPIVNNFTDVTEDDYFFSPVMWAIEKGITDGTSDTTFSPDQDCTRGQIVTFLWRTYGCPEPDSSENPFTDVNEDDYYYDAVLWAVERGITDGTTKTTFSPNAKCTRGQAVTFIWRAEGQPPMEGERNPFTDVTEGDYFFTPVMFALRNKITDGTSDTTFSPDLYCTRGQIVTFLYRYFASEVA